MKNQAVLPATLLLLVLFLFSCSKDTAPVDLSSIEYWGQEELDRHKEALLQTTELDGDVYIVGSDVESLSAFQNIEKIHGALEINSTSLHNLDALARLEEVESLLLLGNKSLETANLSQLVSAEQSIIFIANPALTAINLPVLEKVGQNTTTADIGIYDNRALELVSLPEIQSFYGLYIMRNPQFRTLQGFTKLDSDNDYGHYIILDFRLMDCPANLFENLAALSSFELKAEAPSGNDFEWLANLPARTIVQIETKASLAELCPLVGGIDLGAPGNIEIRNPETGEGYSGIELLEECE